MNHKCGCQVTDAVIFDMDGVIVDSEMLYLNLRWQFAREKNPEVTLEELYPTVGRSSEGSWSLVAEDSTAGITAAHLAGMRVAAVVDDRFGFDRSLADYEVKQISDILQLVEGKTDEKTGGQDK